MKNLLTLFFCLSVSICYSDMQTNIQMEGSDPTILFCTHFEALKSTAVIYDVSSDNNGSIIGGTAWGTGRIGYNLDFDGTGYIDFFDDSVFDLTSSFTIAAWIKLYALADSNTIISKHEPAADNGWNFIHHADNKFYFQGGDGNDWASLNCVSGVYTDLTKWHYVVGTFDGTNGKLYINTVLDGEDTSAVLEANNKHVWIGGDVNTLDANFDGKIDEITIWNRCLTQAEIYKNYSE